jgi:hypothetical protein
MIPVAFAHYLGSLGDARLVWSPNGTNGTIFVGWQPDTPNRSVAVMPQPGASSLDNLAGRNAAVQLICRGATEREAYELAEYISGQLDCLDHTTFATGTDDELIVIGVTVQQDAPVPMGRDDKGRSEYSLNLTARIHNPTAHRPGVSA